MANSTRKNVKKGSKGDVLADPALARRERLTLVLYLLGAVAIVAGMIVLSEFLSQGEPNHTVLYVAGGLFALLAVGVAIVFLMRRKDA